MTAIYQPFAHQLNTDYNQSISGYSFLRVLSAREKRQLLAFLTPSMMLDYPRSIRTADWLRALESISLDTDYYVYRRSYWGESAGCTKISSLKSPSMSLVRAISGADSSQRVNLLIEDNTVRIVNAVTPSCWTNSAYLLDRSQNVLY